MLGDRLTKLSDFGAIATSFVRQIAMAIGGVVRVAFAYLHG